MADLTCCLNSKLSVKELLSTFLFGIEPENGETGERMTDENIALIIDMAYGYLEELYDVQILPKKIEHEYHDYFNDPAPRSYWKFMTDKVPVLWDPSDRTRFPITVRAFFGAGIESNVFPEDWIRVNSPSTGGIHVYPTVGSLGTFLHQFTAVSYALGTFRNEYIPTYFDVDYYAGMCPIPKFVNGLVGKIASLYMLNILGDVGRGAGLSNYSLSIDGLSQSLGTTNSATSSQFGARVHQYHDELKQELQLFKAKYGGLLLAGV
jgi:hypothetical protein